MYTNKTVHRHVGLFFACFKLLTGILSSIQRKIVEGIPKKYREAGTCLSICMYPPFADMFFLSALIPYQIYTNLLQQHKNY